MLSVARLSAVSIRASDKRLSVPTVIKQRQTPPDGLFAQDLPQRKAPPQPAQVQPRRQPMPSRLTQSTWALRLDGESRAPL